VDTAKQKRIEKLVTVHTELIILKPRLTEPYASNIGTCIEILEGIVKEMENDNDEEGLHGSS
jgi:hypothetical protein